MEPFGKLLAAATLLVLPVIAACGEDVIPPPPTGSVTGQVSIEGMGIDDVSVNLSNGSSTTTAGGGTYRFDGRRGRRLRRYHQRLPGGRRLQCDLRPSHNPRSRWIGHS